jgi:hypothetical protein
MSELQKRKLPTITDLYADKELAIRESELNLLLNQPPQPEWVMKHPIIKKEVVIGGQKQRVPYEYIPVQRLEWLMTRIFQNWRREILREGLFANSVYVVMRVHYRNPLTGEMEWTDGVGATPLQTDKGSGATDFNSIKSGAVQMGLPASATFAFKDAVENLGKLFGKDLSRSDEISYMGISQKVEMMKIAELRKALSKVLDENQDTEQSEELRQVILNKENSKEADVEFYQNIYEQLTGSRYGES